MCNIVDVAPSTLKSVKEAVDFIYESTTGAGSVGGWTKYPTRIQRIVSILVQRGIVAKGGHYNHPTYVWTAQMAPTGTLYKTIASEVVLKERETVKRSADKRRAKEMEEMKAKVMEEEAAAVAISSFTSQELWDELKRRGYAIEDGRLVVVKKDYLD